MIHIDTSALIDSLSGTKRPASRSPHAVGFGSREAVIAAELYRSLPSARGREIDLAIAACALASDAALSTLNTADFEDIPGLRLI